MASEEYKGFHISAWARPEYGKGSAAVGIVCKPTRMGSIVEVKRIEGQSFESKEEAERHGLELCKEWIYKRLDHLHIRAHQLGHSVHRF
jgi:hypothetical protein